MSSSASRPRRAPEEPWSTEALILWRSYYVTSSLAPSSRLSYTSALQSYHRFCQLHDFPTKPLADTLSFLLTYRSHSLRPQTLSSYLSGICNQLEAFYPQVRALRQSPIVRHTLAGIHRVHSTSAHRKRPLLPADLQVAIDHFGSSPDYDDALFLAQLLVGFDQLLRLAELCCPDNPQLFDVRRSMRRFDVTVGPEHLQLLLPGNKTDKFFAGSQLLLQRWSDPICPVPYLLTYLRLRDQRFPWRPELWIRQDGSSPCRSWFHRQLRTLFDDGISGHSMRAGGATALAAAGVPSERIHFLGCWSSDSYQVYIRRHPLLLLGQFSP